ncbi:MAG: thiamine phosphate synthase [Gammaproteobacteria bacterium]
MSPPIKNGLYAITDCDNLSFEMVLNKTRLILDAGIAALQYRDKFSAAKFRLDRARALQKLCSQYGVPFLINDDIRIAKQIDADGVHIGRDDPGYQESRAILGEKIIIGVSCYNSLPDAMTAQRMGADYIAFGSFFPTESKKNSVKASPDLITAAKKKLFIPIVAIGGITVENGKPLLEAGADMLACISSLYASDAPQQVVFRFNKLFAETVRVS